jgi:hypothetical protein
MRYNVGQEYPFINITFTHKNGSISDSGMGIYSPSRGDRDLKINSKLLKCESHHKVPVDYSDSIADGFIFLDKEGNKYYNQYPTASYGQTSDEGDRIAIFESPPATVIFYRDACYFIGDLKRWIYYTEKDGRLPYENISTFISQVVSEVEKLTNKRIKAKQLKVLRKDGEFHILKGHYRVELVEKENYTTDLEYHIMGGTKL